MSDFDPRGVEYAHEVIAVSINFPMLSDWDHEVIRAYDAVLEDQDQ
ncbi:MAG: hypothetical protein V5A39_08305 [Haloarculaceae archaeon]